MSHGVSSDAALDIPIVPMIDMSFVLIMFFILTGEEQGALYDEAVKLAQARNVAPIKQLEIKSLVINIREDGSFNIANKTMTGSELKHVLKASVASLGTDVNVILRCDGRTKFDAVDKVIKFVGEAGLWRVRICATVNQ
jgi:biopolymer transport protein ExbD